MANLDGIGSEEIALRLRNELPKKRVLIVDRHPAARDSLRLMLSALGIISVVGAGSGAEVLRQVRANSFDIILSDYTLEDGRDGQQLLEELRLQRLIPLETAFIIVTSERAYQSVISVAELAPDDYILKPFTADQLQARILKAIYRKTFFSPVYRKIEGGAYTAALEACERLLAKPSPFEQDALRLKGEILNTLGRSDDAEAHYRKLLLARQLPWARMGLAIALRAKKALDEAESLAQLVVAEFPRYLSAYDFLAGIREEKGELAAAQQVLQEAATLSPKNATRQRIVGDVALRNGDFEAAEKAYRKVLERHRGSSLRQIDDYTNLSRVLLEKGQPGGARQLIQELKRDWRGNRHGEFAAAVLDSLCLQAEGEPAKARAAKDEALRLHETLLTTPDQAQPLSNKIAIDLAQACLADGDEAAAQSIMRKVAAENNDDRQLISRIEGVFTRCGKEDMGRALLDEVNREIIELNNRGVLAARSGDLEASVRLLIEAAEAIPSVQFLVNAAKAICALMERSGWQEDLGRRAQGYLQQARLREAQDWRVLSGQETFQRVATRYGKVLTD